MFGRKERSNTQKALTIIGEGTSIEGTMLSNGGDIDIQGSFKGLIAAQSVSVRQDGSFNGEMRVTFLNVQGKIDGDIIASEVSIATTGILCGSVRYCILNIESGGRILGQCFPEEKVDNKDSEKKKQSQEKIALGNVTPVEVEEKSNAIKNEKEKKYLHK